MKKKVCIPLGEFIKEHKRLLKVLISKSKAVRVREAKAQGKELKKIIKK